jgi:peptidoglycan/LPS O-acetylase OafA/YrhL
VRRRGRRVREYNYPTDAKMKLQRITTGSRWIPEIDGLRFVAISAVLLLHIFAEVVNRSSVGTLEKVGHDLLVKEALLLSRGVQLFFVISGYILAQPFLRQFREGGKPVSIGGFYLRRLTRLEPPYILSLLLYAVPLLFMRRLTPHQSELSFLTSLFYVHNFVGSRLPMLNLATWSLEVEIEFYLLVPLLASLFRIRGDFARRSLIVLVMLASALLPWTRANMAGFFLPSNMCYFLLGFLLADLHVEQEGVDSHFRWDFASLVLWPAVFFLPDFRFTAVVLCATLTACFYAAFKGPLTRRLISVRWVALLGGMCYSIYLTHMLVIASLFPLTRRAMHFGNLYMDYLSQLVLLVPAILGISLIYYIAIERPCMDPHWPARLLRRFQSALR